MKFVSMAGAATAALVFAASASAAPARPARPAPVQRAVTASLPPLPSVDIPYTRTVLNNGLTLIVHEDHKAPIVAVNIWYHVGSKNEPPGRTGFAHLFEHLMFGGKNGNQKGWFERMEAVGATGLNGTTYFDRTNFFENVPTAALDMTLWLESQRMGHLLDNFDQKVLTTQRGVVQNEKRQDENQPYYKAEELMAKTVWPAAHPYSHSVIGEMADLDAASVDDVKDWFRQFYGPSNAVIVLAGDITPTEAKAKVEKYFGDIPPGPPVQRQKIWIAKRSGEQRANMQDRVALARLYKVWNVPEEGSPDADYLELLSDVMDAGKDSRLYRRLVYQDQIATDVSASVQSLEIGSLFRIQATAKPGVPLDRIEAAVNEELARLLRDGPTPEELERVKTRRVASFVRGLERVGGFGGKSDILAQAQTYRGSPDAWKASLERVRTATAADLVGAGRRWLTDGDLVLDVVPFPNYAAAQTGVDRTAMPQPGPTKPASFVHFQRATLSNGMKVIVAERHETPTVTFDMVFDAGEASDENAKPGTASLTAALLSDGTQSLDALQFSDRLMGVGAAANATVGLDTTQVTLNALSARLDLSLDLYADVLLHPGFRDADVAREKKLAIAAIQQQKQNPVLMAFRVEPTLVYGPHHAYGDLPTEASVAALGRDDLVRYYQTWFHPNDATLVVVGDTTLAAILPKLEARFGAWRPAPIPAKSIGPVQPRETPVVYLIDKPGAIQSVIMAGGIAPPRVNPEDVAIQAMNTTLGGAFTSRLNMNLREDKHWSYGANSFIAEARGPSLFMALAPVQTDKTKESFVEVRRELTDVLQGRPVTAEELALAKNDLTLSLAGRWETTGAVASTIAQMVGFGLPDSYYDSYVQRISDLTPAEAERAAGVVVKPNSLTWVVVGDRAKIEPQLRSLGLDIKPIDADARPVA